MKKKPLFERTQNNNGRVEDGTSSPLKARAKSTIDLQDPGRLEAEKNQSASIINETQTEVDC